MNTKEELLALLLDNQDIFLSSKDITKKLNVSRTAIWKACNKLKDEGFIIKAIPNKGYKLEEKNDILNKDKILEKLLYKNTHLDIYDELSSTNKFLKEKQEEKDEWSIIIARKQTQGKGRLGRSFYSPSDSGIYMSILLKPKNLDTKYAIRITTMAAVCITRAIKKILNIDTKIKWVNDIYFNNKKVAGILTEGTINLENSYFDYVVLGIGLNVYHPKNGFTKDIKDIATFLCKEKTNGLLNDLTSEIINQLYLSYNFLSNDDFFNLVKEYKEKSFIINKNVNIISPLSITEGKVIDIDDECRLIVQNKNGKIDTINSGEISIRVTK